MKIFICIKQVPDVSAPLQIKDGRLIQDSDRMILNAYDASAVEEALVLAEQHDGDITTVLIGPEKAGETIRKSLAMGADRGVHILSEDGDRENFDSATYAHILSTFFSNREQEYDYIFCGKQSQDTDAGLTGGMLAEQLGLPFVTNAVGLDMEGENLIVKRQGDAGQEILELSKPGLVTCSNDMNEPRIPSLKGIMQSKRKPVETLSLDDLGLDRDTLKAKTRVLSFEEKGERQAGKKFEGEAEDVAREVARLLDEEANVLE